MDNKKLANWLLSETFESFKDFSLNEGFEDMKFPIKFHTNIVEYAKKFVTEEISNMSDDDFKEHMDFIKHTALPLYLKAKTKDELIKIAVNELEHFKMENVFKKLENGVAIIKDEKEFVDYVGRIFSAIAVQLSDELQLDISKSKFSKIDTHDGMFSNIKNLYAKIISNPKVYGTIANI
jgi:hypothetical protein